MSGKVKSARTSTPRKFIRSASKHYRTRQGKGSTLLSTAHAHSSLPLLLAGPLSHSLQEMLDLHMDFCAPGGESLRHVQERAIGYLEPLIEQWKEVSIKEGREVVIGVFGHGGCIRVMLHHFVGVHDPLTWLLQQENTTMNELLIDPRGVSTIRINDDSHLRYTMATPPNPETHAKL